MNSMIASISPKGKLPTFTPNTPSYNDEGTSVTGWTQTNAIPSNPSASVLRLTQNVTGTQSFLRRAVTMPVSGQDFCLYGRVRARASAGDTSGVQIIGTGSLRYILYLNFNSVTALNAPGTISIRYVGGTGTTYNMVAATGVDTATDWLDFALYFDKAFNTLSMYTRQTNGAWKFGAHVFAGSFGGELAVTTNNASTASAWVEFDFLTLVSADLIAIGDSITKGATLFDPQQSGGLSDGDSNWMRWAPMYTSLRNSLIVNKGIGGNTSTMVAARIAADVIANGPKVVLLGACNNDAAQGVSHATRTTNVQSSINAILAAGAKCVLYNALYYTAAHASQPAYRVYFETWWTDYRCTLTGRYNAVNPMVAVRDAAGYLDAAYAQADGIHPNVAGYTRYGKYMAGIKLS